MSSVPSEPEEMTELSTHSISSKDNLSLSKVIESIQLIQQLHQSSLNLTIRTSSLTEPPSTNSINLIHEDDTRFVFLRVSEHFSNESCGFSDVFVDDRGGDDFEEICRESCGDCSCEESLSGSGRSIEENTCDIRRVSRELRGRG